LLLLLANGLSNKEIATRTNWSLGTVKKYIQRLFDTLNVSDRTQAVATAMRNGLIQ
jgi:DNA-binding NarL/FixJ family response regulator